MQSRVHLSWRVVVEADCAIMHVMLTGRWVYTLRGSASFAMATAAAGASGAAASAATFPATGLLEEAVEEGMMKGLLQAEPLCRIVLHHLLYQVKK